MSLIEQLGGYEKAREMRHYLFCYVDGDHYMAVDAALLEYRRQHNIFEVGDLIFDLSDDDKKYTGQILKVGEIGLDFLVCHDNQGKRFCVITDDAIHASDEEIQAGRRL